MTPGGVAVAAGRGASTPSWARRALDDALWGPESGRRLRFLHAALATLIGLRVVLGPYRALAEVPPALFEPVPVLGVLDRMPSAGTIVALQVVGGVAALAAVLRRRPRLAFALAWACLLVLAGLRGSRGKVLHNDLLLLWASAPLLLAPVEAAWHDRERRRRWGWPVRTSMVLSALVYFFAGYHKVRRAGLDWAVGDNVRYVMLWGPTIGRARWESMARWVGENLWASQLTGAYILAVELTFPLAVLWRRSRGFYVASAVALHVATWFLLGLDYWAWAATVLVVFVDWPAMGDRLRGRGAMREAAAVAR
ncbi:MAG: hypothetical protein AB7L84_15355 [Acidimicrobiia bacterium]